MGNADAQEAMAVKLAKPVQEKDVPALTPRIESDCERKQYKLETKNEGICKMCVTLVNTMKMHCDDDQTEETEYCGLADYKSLTSRMIMAECSEEKERNHAVRTSCHAMLGHVQRSTEPDVKLFYDDSPERTCTFATGYMCASELEDRIDNVMLLQTKVDPQLGK